MPPLGFGQVIRSLADRAAAGSANYFSHLGPTNFGKRVFSGTAGMGMRTAGRAANFAVRHPALTLGTAAAAGMFTAHPLQKTGAVLEEGIWGDPNALSKITLGKYNTFAQNLGIPMQIRSSPYERQRRAALVGGEIAPPPIPSEDTLYRAATRLSTRPRPTGMNPDGSLVFGLYNDRLV